VAANDRELNLSVAMTGSGRAGRKGGAARASSRSAGVRRACLIGYWLAIFFMTHWPRIEDFPHPPWLFPQFDLVVHFCLYAGWAAAWVWVLIGEGKWAGARTAKWVALGGAAYSLFDEFTQLIVGRDAEIGDILADLAGVVVVLALASRWWRRRVERRRRWGG
jgi:VanZ family protein